jgi:16S rRNA processing protein RimM
MGEIAIGRVRKPHGVKGYLKVMSFSGEYDHFFDLEHITLKNKDRTLEFKVDQVVPHSGEILMKLEGVDNPERGRQLSGWDIWVSRAHAVSRDSDEFYHADLVGCQVELKGEAVGTVVSILEAGADDLLEIEAEEERKLIPFNSVFIGSVDTDNKRIELLEGWILD